MPDQTVTVITVFTPVSDDVSVNEQSNQIKLVLKMEGDGYIIRIIIRHQIGRERRKIDRPTDCSTKG